MYPYQGYDSIMIKRVVIGKRARKQLKKAPGHVAEKLAGWVSTVEETGVEDARKIPGYHDEPLLGARKGHRSIRLTISYRAIYEIKKYKRDEDKLVEFVSVNEVTKHEY
jgi:proteic killer suppression protein